MSISKRHFLVIASASRGAKLFIKKALLQGHDVTAMCRANSDKEALQRMTTLLDETPLTDHGRYRPLVHGRGQLKATCISILEPESYHSILTSDLSIDAVCCFVGVTKYKDMLNPKYTVYTDTIRALVEGMKQSRWVETYYHGSVGTEGIPGASVTAWPANYNVVANLLPVIFPVYKNVTESEVILAQGALDGLKYVIFRPAALKDTPATGKYGYCFDTTGLNKKELPLKHAKISIGREDVAEEMLRVTTLPGHERERWYGHGVYLVDMKDSYKVTTHSGLPHPRNCGEGKRKVRC